MELELVAYPGILLTSPTSEEAEEGAGLGMVDRFFHVRFPLNERTRMALTCTLLNRCLPGRTSLLSSTSNRRSF